MEHLKAVDLNYLAYGGDIDQARQPAPLAMATKVGELNSSRT